MKKNKTTQTQKPTAAPLPEMCIVMGDKKINLDDKNKIAVMAIKEAYKMAGIDKDYFEIMYEVYKAKKDVQ